MHDRRTLHRPLRGRIVPPFVAPYAPPDEDDRGATCCGAAARAADAEARIDARARRLVEAIRAQAGGLGGIEDFLRDYSLSTKEGLALMVLAEALLRVPDAATADRLIEDKLAAGDLAHHEAKSSALLVSASAWALGITARIIQPGETPETILDRARQAARPAGGARRDAPGDAAARLAFRARPDHRGGADARRAHREFRYSFDMLGEGARTAPTPSAISQAMPRAIAAIGARRGNAALPDRPGISVKLSALHPRYEAVSRERVLAELVPRVLELARARQGA